MNYVIEIDTLRLVDITNDIWKKYAQNVPDFIDGVSTIDYSMLDDKLLSSVKRQVPWVSGKVCFIIFEPGAVCPIHTDLHDEGYYQRSFNILVESDGDNHSTRYYKYLPGIYDAESKGNMFNEDLSNLEIMFEFTLRKPTLFYNQVLHDVNNYGNARRVTALWLVDPAVTDEEIKNWCKENQINYRIVFDGIY